MNTITKQDEVQLIAVQKAEENNYNCYLLLATGSGKSKIAIDIHRRFRDKKVLLLVPTEPLRDVNWAKEYRKWKEIKLYNQLERMCYASAYKLENQHYDLVIADEVDVLASPEFSKFWRNNHTKHFIGLTAHVPGKAWELLPRYPVAFRYTLQEAVKDEVISPYTVEVINVQMSSKEREEYNKQSSAIEYFRSTGRETKMLNFKRARFLYQLPSKVSIARAKLVEMLNEDRRVFVNAESTDMVDLITSEGYHSNNPEADEVLKKFLKKKSVVIGSAKKLNRGMNLGPLQGLLLVSYTQSIVAAIQKIGRTVRFEDGKLTRVIFLVTLETVEVNWFNKIKHSI